MSKKLPTPIKPIVVASLCKIFKEFILLGAEDIRLLQKHIITVITSVFFKIKAFKIGANLIPVPKWTFVVFTDQQKLYRVHLVDIFNQHKCTGTELMLFEREQITW